MQHLRGTTVAASLALIAGGAVTTAASSTAAIAPVGTPWAGVSTYCDGYPVSSALSLGDVTLDNLASPTVTTFVVKKDGKVISTTKVGAGSGASSTFDLAYGQRAVINVTANGKTMVSAKAVTGNCLPAGATFNPAAPIHVDCRGLPKIDSNWKRTIIWLDNGGKKMSNTFRIDQSGRAAQTITLGPGKSLQVLRTTARGRIDKIKVTAYATNVQPRTVSTATTANVAGGTGIHQECVRGTFNRTVDY
jgi:hypothetical protein